MSTPPPQPDETTEVPAAQGRAPLNRSRLKNSKDAQHPTVESRADHHEAGESVVRGHAKQHQINRHKNNWGPKTNLEAIGLQLEDYMDGGMDYYADSLFIAKVFAMNRESALMEETIQMYEQIIGAINGGYIGGQITGMRQFKEQVHSVIEEEKEQGLMGKVWSATGKKAVDTGLAVTNAVISKPTKDILHLPGKKKKKEAKFQ